MSHRQGTAQPAFDEPFLHCTYQAEADNVIHQPQSFLFPPYLVGEGHDDVAQVCEALVDTLRLL